MATLYPIRVILTSRAFKRIVEFIVLIVALMVTSAYAREIDELLLTRQDISTPCQMIEGMHPTRNAVQVFYDHGVYDELLPLMLNKRAQSFQCGQEKGTLYYFEYTDNPQREKAEVFARTTLWGVDSKPSPAHPEQIFHWDRYLMVLSFKDIQKELLASLLNKFKRMEGSPLPR